MQDSDFTYVSVIFEDRINSTLENPKFYGKDYLYKTKKILTEGQVIVIDTLYGTNKAVVYRANIDPAQALAEARDIGYSLESLKEI